MPALRITLSLVLLLFTPALALADVRLPSIIGDNMVLQRDQPLTLWGWADPGESVTVSFRGQQAASVATAEGEWSVTIGPFDAGGPGVLTTSGSNEIALENVLVGDVWLFSGQSNMEWGVKNSNNPEAEIAAADYPDMRLFLVPKVARAFPAEDVDAEWKVCSPETIVEGGGQGFSAVAYFFGREIHQEVGVPMGLIATSWGGTRIEPWTPPVGFAQVPALSSITKGLRLRDPSTSEHKAMLSEAIADTEQWLASARETLQANTPPSPSPSFPAELLPDDGRQSPTTLYNAMIHPLLPYAIRGAAWYQGESNHTEGMLYTEKMNALIRGWRTVWDDPDLPFYYVQIAPYRYGAEDPVVLPEFWEAQTAAELAIPNTGMAVISDIGNLDDIHPRNKQEVGRRLALMTLRDVYGKDVVASGPTFKALGFEDGALRVRFDHADGLASRDGEPLTWFQIIDEKQGGWVDADARIDGKSVILAADSVPNPVAMRFAWHKLAEPNLVNGAGLPAGAFRAGEVPDRDALAMYVPKADEYELLYDLDLKDLGETITYDVDNSADFTGPFDRVAYILEIENDGRVQFAFASMDAFTDDPSLLGVPTAESGARFHQRVQNLTVVSNVDGVANGENLLGGFIEFWPNNYQQNNEADVPGARNDLYDFGDQPADPVVGYGCMQVHNISTKQTVLAFNHWRARASADIGLGNRPEEHPDWTFSQSAQGIQKARLRVLVRPSEQAP